MKRNTIAPNNESFTDINKKLNNLKIQVSSILNRIEANNIENPKKYLKHELDRFLDKRIIIEQLPGDESFFSRYEKYIEDSNFSSGRKKHYYTNIKKLKSFYPEITFDTLTPQILTDFQNYMLNKFDNSRNTVSGEMKRLRAFLNYALKNNWTNQYPFKSFSIEPEIYGDPVYITIEERDLLYYADNISPHLQRVRDIFVFQCFIGCRVGDLVKLTKSNIINGCIEYIAGKTADDKPRVARIPLTEKALAILAKYKIPDGKLLPFITDQRYNKYIKDLFKAVGLNRIVTIHNPKTRTGKQVPICDIAASHMARRVFVGSLYKKDVKNEIIASMTGHTSYSKSFGRYHNIDKEDQMNAVKLIE
jgi:integrase